MTLDQTFVQQALEYAARGWAVFPLAPKTKRPITEHGLYDATTDPATIRRWWAAWPDANIGIACGASGLVVVDVDAKNGAPGLDTWQGLLPQIGGQIDTPTVQTPTGGLHFYYAAPPGVDLSQGNGKLGPGVDVKGNGGYVVAPPSIHPDTGTAYQWFDGYSLDDREILPLPAYFVRVLQRKQAPTSTRLENRDVFALARDIVEAGKALQRLAPWRCEEYGAWVDVGMALSELGAAGFELWDKWSQRSAKYDPEVCAAKWATFTPANGDPNKISLGSLINWAREDSGEMEYTPAAPHVTPENDLTELMNARRLVALFGQQLRYVSEWGWMAWTGKRWERDTTGAVMRYAKETALSYYQDAAQAASAGDSDKAKELAQHAKRSQSARAIRAMVELAQSELEVIARPEDFDNDPWVLNCENGTLDLRTGELRPHDPADLLTKLCPVNYDPAATCPTWERFQNEIAAECAAIVAYKQRMYGYSLTGDVSEQAFFIAYGTGANGKSTEVNTIRAILGPDYAWHIPTESLLTKAHGGGIPNDLARLKGMRFVTAIESDLGRRLAEGLVKQLTGGDPITARYMRAEFFTFDPTHKLILATNHKPEIWGSDHAIWRRIKLIPYTVTIPKARQDKDLPEKLLAEAAGILAWLVRGCLAWQREGLAEPGEVTNATNAYRQEQDVIGEFLADRCIFKPTATVAKGELYEAYVTWCETNKETPLSKRKFGGKITERGDVAEDKSTGGLRVWVGIGLLAEANSGVSGVSGKNSLFCKEKFSLRETNGEIAPLTPLTPLEDPDEVVLL